MSDEMSPAGEHLSGLSDSAAERAERAELAELELALGRIRGRIAKLRPHGPSDWPPAGPLRPLSESALDAADLGAAETLARLQFRALADALPQIIWTAEPDGTVDFVNEAFYAHVGCRAHALPAQQWMEAVHPDDVPASMEAWSHAFFHSAPYAQDFRLRHHLGHYEWHHVTGQPVRGADGVIVKWYGAGLNIDARKRAEEHTEALARRLQSTLQSTSDAVYTLDSAWRFGYLNPRAEVLLRHAAADLVGRNVWEAFPEAVQTVTYGHFVRCMEARVALEFEVYFPPLEIWFDVSAFPSDDGGIAVYFRDVTTRHEARARLEQSEARFRAIARATADAVWDWDLQAGTVWRSDGFETVFGHPLTSLAPEIEGWALLLHPDDRGRVVAGLMQAVQTRQPSWSDRYRLRHGAGGWRQVEDRGWLVCDAAGEPVRLVGGLVDITAQQHLIARLQEQAALLDQARDAIIVRQPDHTIRFWNRSAERIYGWTAAEAVGASIATLLYASPEAFEAATAQVFAAGHWAGRLEQRTRAGRRIVVDANWTLVRDTEGQPSAVLAINTDITEQLETEAQLHQAQRLEAVGQLTGGVAHDFNNLLTVMLGNAEMLVEQLDASPRLRLLAELTRSAAERGAQLTHRLLAFARRQPLDPRATRVDRLVAGMSDLLSRALGGNIEVRIVSPPDLWEALVDAPQVESAVLNLCINARDAMGDGGCLTVETTNSHLDADYAAAHQEVVPGDYVLIAVSDTGAGMAPEVVARAFDPFFTTKPQGAGSGLGLSMVYGFVKQSRGHVKIYSEVGQGTTVKLYLPRVGCEALPAEASWVAGEVPVGSERVLLVEDDPLVRAHVAGQLAGLGYGVVLAENGPMALEILGRDAQIDLLFTDVVMPGGMNGRQLADAALRLRPGLPVLFTSGYTENAIVHHGRLDAGVALLNKPFRRAELAQKLRLVLDRP